MDDDRGVDDCSFTQVGKPGFPTSLADYAQQTIESAGSPDRIENPQ
jgi:hypothetical protein